MAVELTVVMYFANGSPPPLEADLRQLLEDELDCVVLAAEEEEV
jgi:hypothetical protein